MILLSLKLNSFCNYLTFLSYNNKNTIMKNKISIGRLTTILLLSIIFSSCGTTHIEFTIHWVEVWKTIGLILLGAVIVIGILLYIFRNFRIY